MARLGMALTAGASAFRRAYADPDATSIQNAAGGRAERYRYLWEWYRGSVYDDLTMWARYRADYKLYRNIRGIYNPARRLVDFYAAAVYPGVLTVDRSRLPAGTPSALPLADDTPPELAAAIGQFYQWSNLQQLKGLFVRYGAAMGCCLGEIDDDVARGKVATHLWRPEFVDGLQLDSAGNVKAYAIQYQAVDAAGKGYTYRRAVDGETIRTYRDGSPYSYDVDDNGTLLPAEWEHGYGFAPAVWAMHTNLGDDAGAPALRNIGKLDEINSLAAHAHDQLHKLMAAPVLIAGDSVVDPAKLPGKGPATQQQQQSPDREQLPLLIGAQGSTVSTLPLDIGQTLEMIRADLAEIEADHPELTMYSQLRSMSNVTGPAAQRLMGDVAILVLEAQAAYDQQMTKLLQMAVAIGGQRANSGAWGPALNRQQQHFLPFGLDSYRAGQLDLTILPRPLLLPVPGEGLTEQANAIAALTNAGAGLRQAAMVAGMSEADAMLLEQGEMIPGVEQ
jgi:hypothetical protein